MMYRGHSLATQQVFVFNFPGHPGPGIARFHATVDGKQLLTARGAPRTFHTIASALAACRRVVRAGAIVQAVFATPEAFGLVRVDASELAELATLTAPHDAEEA